MSSNTFDGYFKKFTDTIKVDGYLVLFIRIYKFAIVLLKRFVFRKKFQLRYEKVKILKNTRKDKTLFILGNGPSLNVTPLYLLKNSDTFCFNRANLLFEKLNWNPTYYMVTDDLVIQDMKDEIPYILEHVDTAFFPDLHPSNVDFTKIVKQREKVFWINTCYPNFSSDLPNCGINKTVVNAAIQVGVYLGYSKICLMGVDVNYVKQDVIQKNNREWTAKNDDDPNHFDSRYFGKDRSYHNPSTSEMIQKFGEAKEFFKNHSVEIVNVGIGGKLEVFRRSTLEEELDISEEESLLLFIEAVNRNLTKETVLDFIQTSDDTLFFQENCYLIKKELSIIEIKKLSKTNNVIGPFKSVYAVINQR